MTGTASPDVAATGIQPAPVDALVRQAIAASRAYGREDLVAHLASVASRLSNPGVALFVVGEYKQGKSSLVNALLNVSLCPVDDDVPTAVPTVVRHGTSVSARAIVASQKPENGGLGLAASPIEIDDVADLVTGRAMHSHLHSVELSVPRQLLASGLVMIDTPGVGGLESEFGAATIGSLQHADAVLFVTDASQELTRTEIELLTRAAQSCRILAVVLTKTDLYPHWRRIADLNASHLMAAGVAAALLPVSSTLRRRAVTTGDQDLNARSGFAELVTWIQDQAVGRAAHVAAANAAVQVMDACDQLRLQFEAERQMLADPDRLVAVRHALEVAQERATHLRSGAARWQIALNDGIQDLTSDVDHDLRTRFRDVMNVADARLDSGDPLDIWDEFEPWLRQYVTEQVAANFGVLTERAELLEREIARLFVEDEAELALTMNFTRSTPAIDLIDVRADLDQSTKPTVVDTTLGVLRGGYGGMLMFGMLAGMIGVTMVAPVSVVIGLAMGGRHQRQEKKRRLVLRRQEARQAYRKYTDAVIFEVGKQSRDTLRQVHRELRDSWAERAQQLQRSANLAVEAATAAADVEDADRAQRLSEVEAELQRIDALRSSAGDVAERIVP
jgi:hypothetical protein